MADDILKNIPLPADLPENWTSGQIIAPTGAEAGLDEQHGYNYLMMQVNNVQKALKAFAAQREEDLARVKYWASDDPTSPASFIGGTWERIEDCTIWGASDAHPAGTKLEAGLPNITGNFTIRNVENSGNDFYTTIPDSSGTFYAETYDTQYSPMSITNSNTTCQIVKFLASRSNGIYGQSNTVQPPAYCMYIWRRVA